jgi:hypothetical protein
VGAVGKRRIAHRRRESRFEVLLTTDKNLSHQQNFSRRKIAVVVLGKGRWSLMKPYVAQIIAAVEAATPGSLSEVEIPYE